MQTSIVGQIEKKTQQRIVKLYDNLNKDAALAEAVNSAVKESEHAGRLAR